MIKDILHEVEVEYNRSNTIHGKVQSEMEGLGIITEEYYEVVEVLRGSSKDRKITELIQLSNTCVKTVEYIQSNEQ